MCMIVPWPKGRGAEAQNVAMEGKVFMGLRVVKRVTTMKGAHPTRVFPTLQEKFSAADERRDRLS